MNEWDGFAKTYSSTLGLATKPFSIDILKSITINKNDTILDVACGSGTIQTALVDFINDGLISKQVKMIAIDNSGQMIQEVEELRSKYPVLDPIMTTQCIDGELLKEIADESIDIVTSSLGVILFKNRNKGFRNIFRVLKPSGQFVFSKWESTPKDIGMGIIDLTYFIFDLFPGQEEAAMKRRQLLNNDGKPVDEIRMKKSLKTIGFSEASWFHSYHTMFFKSFEDLWQFIMEFSPKVSLPLNLLDTDKLADIKSKVMHYFKSYNSFSNADSIVLHNHQVIYNAIK